MSKRYEVGWSDPGDAPAMDRIRDVKREIERLQRIHDAMYVVAVGTVALFLLLL